MHGKFFLALHHSWIGNVIRLKLVGWAKLCERYIYISPSSLIQIRTVTKKAPS